MALMKHRFIRTGIFAGLVLVLSLGHAGSGLAREADDRNAHLTTEDRALVDAVSAWFNGVETLKGQFDQQNQDGSLVSGDFYLRRPGRMRFEYAAPQQLTLLSDGLWVMLNDREFESVDRYPLRETPLWLILKKHVDLAKDALIVRVDREGGLTGVTVRSDDNDAQGALTLVFVGDQRLGLELRHWVIEDVQGKRTVVSLRQIEQGMALSPELFIPDEYEFGEDED
jgi:outer membrane lipoprotein-sorting protein